MKTFIKWTLSGLVFLIGITLLSTLTEKFDKSRLGVTTIAIIIGSVALGLLFYFLERKYVPWRKKNISNRLLKLFNANKISDSISTFQLEGFDFIAQIDFHLVMSQYGNTELISFHIPRKQIDVLQSKPDFKLIPDHCNGKETYCVYKTNSWGLGLAKKRIEKKLTERFITLTT